MKKNKIIAIITLFLGTFIALMDTTIVNIAIPEMLDYFSCSFTEVSWVTTGYNLAFAVLLITASRLADQFGRKKAFIFGIFLFTTTSLLAGISTSIEMLILFRVIQGFSAAFIVPVTMPLAIEIVPEEKKGLVIGIWGAFAGFVATLGPVLGGLLTEKLNWQSIFFINIPIGIVTILLSYYFIKESYDETASKKIDYLGIFFLSVFLFCLTFAFAQVSDKGWTSSYILILFAISLLFAILFILIESKVTDPMVPLKIVKVKTFSFSSLTLFILGLGLTSGTLIITLLLTTIMGQSELKAGLIVSTLALSSMVTSVISGKLLDKLGGRWFSVIGMLALTITTYLYGTIRYDSPISQVILLLSVTGLAIGFVMGPAMGSSIRQIPNEKIGIASGVVNMMRSVGQGLGIAILATVLSSNITSNMASTKKEVVSIIEKSEVLDNAAKQEVINSMKIGNMSRNSNNSKILDAINKKEKEILAKTPEQYKAKVKESFEIQKKEILYLRSKISEVYNNNISDAFSYTFQVAGWIVSIGIIFALFSDISPAQLSSKKCDQCL